jgi:hypothetical protein
VKVVRVCPYCGHKRSQKALFCEECGTSLEAANSQSEQQLQTGFGILHRKKGANALENSAQPRGRSETSHQNERIIVAVAVLLLTATALFVVLYHAVDTSRERSLYANLALNSSITPATKAGDLSSQYTDDLQQRGLTIIHPFLKGIDARGHDTYAATATDGKFTYDVIYEFTSSQNETQARYNEVVASLQKEGYIVGLDNGAAWTGYNVGYATTVKNAGADVVVIRATINVNYFVPFPVHLF